jgi:hypothetical protein
VLYPVELRAHSYSLDWPCLGILIPSVLPNRSLVPGQDYMRFSKNASVIMGETDAETWNRMAYVREPALAAEKPNKNQSNKIMLSLLAGDSDGS